MSQTEKKPSDVGGQKITTKPKPDFKAPAPEEVGVEIPSPAEELEQSVLEIYQAIEREADPKNKAYGLLKKVVSKYPSESQIRLKASDICRLEVFKPYFKFQYYILLTTTETREFETLQVPGQVPILHSSNNY